MAISSIKPGVKPTSLLYKPPEKDKTKKDKPTEEPKKEKDPTVKVKDDPAGKTKLNVDPVSLKEKTDTEVETTTDDPAGKTKFKPKIKLTDPSGKETVKVKDDPAGKTTTDKTTVELVSLKEKKPDVDPDTSTDDPEGKVKYKLSGDPVTLRTTTPQVDKEGKLILSAGEEPTTELRTLDPTKTKLEMLDPTRFSLRTTTPQVDKDGNLILSTGEKTKRDSTWSPEYDKTLLTNSKYDQTTLETLTVTDKDGKTRFMSLEDLKTKLISGDTTFLNGIDFQTLQTLYQSPLTTSKFSTTTTEEGANPTIEGGKADTTSPLWDFYKSLSPKHLGIDMTNLPPGMRGVLDRLNDIINDKGGEIISYGLDKLKVDRSFEDPKTIFNMDLNKLDRYQQAAYYMDLLKAKQLNDFLDYQYGDVLAAENYTTGLKIGPLGTAGDRGIGATSAVGVYIDNILKRLETNDGAGPGAKETLMELVNDNVSEWAKTFDAGRYQGIHNTFTSIFRNDVLTEFLQEDRKSPLDGMKALNTTSLLAKTVLTGGDFEALTPKLSNAFNTVMGAVLHDGLHAYGDDVIALNRAGERTEPPTGLSDFNKWYDALTDDSRTKKLRPTIDAMFATSDIAKQLTSQGVKEGDDTWKAFQNVFFKDTTLMYNNLWGNVRRDVKLDVAFSKALIYGPSGSNGVNVERDFVRDLRAAGFGGSVEGLGIDGDMFRAGAFHTVQTASMAAALTGTVMAGQEDGKIDAKEALGLTYASTVLADMVMETVSKYIDPKAGAIKKLGWASQAQLDDFTKKYLGGNTKMVEAIGKMMAGAGTVIFGAQSLWKVADAIKDKDPVLGLFNGLTAGGSILSGLTAGTEGLLQANIITADQLGALLARNVTYAKPDELIAFDAMLRGRLGTFGFLGGMVAGLGLQGIATYDFAKQVKAFDKGLKEADKTILPTTGWHYYDTWIPDSSFTPGV